MAELYFEFRTSACSRLMEILTLTSHGSDQAAAPPSGQLSLRLAADNSLQLNERPVALGGQLCDGRWHAVVVERSHLGTSLALDGVQVNLDRIPSHCNSTYIDDD